METLVIPGIENVYVRERARDELPQSGSGRTIMTAEPKFVPEDAVDVSLEDGVNFRVRLIDCVGYMVDGAAGSMEDGEVRMVSTPWFDHPIPMPEAAETGTRKVIAEHSTIGIVITTDGTVTDIDRDSYVEAEERVITELKELGKPFIVLVNSAYPEGPAAVATAEFIREKYDVSAIAVDALVLEEPEISKILRAVLGEFPIREVGVFLPAWVEALDTGHPIKRELFAAMTAASSGMKRIRDVEAAVAAMRDCESISGVRLVGIDMGTGIAVAKADLPRALFYNTLCEQSGFDVADDGDLMSLLVSLAAVKSEYDKVAAALADVRETGYGIVLPTTDELTLEEPEIVKQGGRYGVRLRAGAPSIHMLRADIQTEVGVYKKKVVQAKPHCDTVFDVAYRLVG